MGHMGHMGDRRDERTVHTLVRRQSDVFQDAHKVREDNVAGAGLLQTFGAGTGSLI